MILAGRQTPWHHLTCSTEIVLFQSIQTGSLIFLGGYFHLKACNWLDRSVRGSNKEFLSFCLLYGSEWYLKSHSLKLILVYKSKKFVLVYNSPLVLLNLRKLKDTFILNTE